VAAMNGFIAKRMPQGVRGALEGVADELKRRGVEGEWTRKGTHHLTIRYFGEIEEDEYAAVAEALREPCAALDELPEFSVGPLFTFENGEGQTVLAARARPREDLQRLFRTVERAAVGCGAEPSEYPTYRPHVTLCYLPDGGAWGAAKREADIPPSFGTFRIGSVDLHDRRSLEEPWKRVAVGRPRAATGYHRAASAVRRLLAGIGRGR